MSVSENYNRAKRKQSLVFFAGIFIIAIATVAAVFYYRNKYCYESTRENLGVLVKACKGGKLVDYQNKIDVSGSEDIKVKHNPILKMDVLYYGNYAVYISTIESESWSYAALKEYLSIIGIKCSLKNNVVNYTYYNEEISVVN